MESGGAFWCRRSSFVLKSRLEGICGTVSALYRCHSDEVDIRGRHGGFGDPCNLR